MAYELNGMANAIDIKSLQSITIESMQSITLKVGPNSIVIDPTGITINGMKLALDTNAEISLSTLHLKEEAMLKESTIEFFQIGQ